MMDNIGLWLWTALALFLGYDLILEFARRRGVPRHVFVYDMLRSLMGLVASVVMVCGIITGAREDLWRWVFGAYIIGTIVIAKLTGQRSWLHQDLFGGRKRPES
jgi:hypothetical protein